MMGQLTATAIRRLCPLTLDSGLVSSEGLNRLLGLPTRQDERGPGRTEPGMINGRQGS